MICYLMSLFQFIQSRIVDGWAVVGRGVWTCPFQDEGIYSIEPLSLDIGRGVADATRFGRGIEKRINSSNICDYLE